MPLFPVPLRCGSSVSFRGPPSRAPCCRRPLPVVLLPMAFFDLPDPLRWRCWSPLRRRSVPRQRFLRNYSDTRSTATESNFRRQPRSDPHRLCHLGPASSCLASDVVVSQTLDHTNPTRRCCPTLEIRLQAATTHSPHPFPEPLPPLSPDVNIQWLTSHR